MLDPVVISPPVRLELTIDPALDPYGRPWSVQLTPVGAEAVRPVTLGPNGVWRKEGLAGGHYRLVLSSGKGRYEYRWLVEEVALTQAVEEKLVEVQVVEVEGTLSLGRKPLKGLIWFGGTSGTRQIQIDSGEDGNFAGYLPNEGVWKVTVDAPEVGRRSLKAVEVKKAPGARAALVNLKLPATELRGEVVDEQGRPVVDALVSLFHQTEDQDLNLEKTDEEGRFRAVGVSEGTLGVSATHFATGSNSDMVVVVLQEDLTPPELRLVVQEQVKLQGRVGWQGRPLPGVEVVAIPLLPEGVGSAYQQGALVTDPQGMFEVRVPSGAVAVDVTLLPPGFPVQTVSLSPPWKETKQLSVELGSGTLRLINLSQLGEGQRGPDPILHHDGRRLLIGLLRRWATSNGGQANADAVTIPRMAIGEYSLCKGRFSPDCTGGFLTPDGVLTLDMASTLSPAHTQ